MGLQRSQSALVHASKPVLAARVAVGSMEDVRGYDRNSTEAAHPLGGLGRRFASPRTAPSSEASQPAAARVTTNLGSSSLPAGSPMGRSAVRTTDYVDRVSRVVSKKL